MTLPLLTKKVNAIIDYLNQVTTPEGRSYTEGLAYWQDRVVRTILLTGLILGLFAYIPSVLLCIKEKLWGVAVFDTAIYAMVCVLFIYRRIPFSVRAYALIFSSYLLGMVLLSIVGPGASGPVWLFVFPVLAGVILGFRASMTALLVNIITLIIIGILVYIGIPRWLNAQPHTLARWVTISFNFILLNAIAALSISMVLKGLQQTVAYEKSLRLSLEKEIADRIIAEKEKQRLQEGLMQAQKMESIGSLAGGIAHDFNNILSSILGFTEICIEDTEKNSIMQDNLEEIFIAGKRARDLVKQILAFARQSDEEIRPVQVSLITKEVLKFIRSSIPTTIDITQNIDSNSLIMGNATQVHQILMNLCTNAAQAMEEKGGILSVSLSDINFDTPSSLPELPLTPGNYLQLAISDTGMGISPDVIGSIFNPYFTTKKQGEGTGLGLATTHGIVESYGGKITVSSILGEGTCFTVYLPVTKKLGEHIDRAPEQVPSGTERILFVDDEMPITIIGKKTLERLGYTVTTRTSALEALELFRMKPDAFDLVITDMTMPNMTGDVFAGELTKIRPDIPIIVCTGYSKKISEEAVGHLGIRALVYKPIIKVELAKTVRKVLDSE